MTILHIQGMKCQHCAATAQKALEDSGATEVRIDLSTSEARFEGQVDREALSRSLAAQGFTVTD